MDRYRSRYASAESISRVLRRGASRRNVSGERSPGTHRSDPENRRRRTDRSPGTVGPFRTRFPVRELHAAAKPQFSTRQLRCGYGCTGPDVPSPFANVLAGYVDSRPHLRAAGGLATSPWLFPSVRRPASSAQREHGKARTTGHRSACARNTALQSLVVAAPAPLVAELLGYSYNTVPRHAEIAAQPWARYVTKTAIETT